MATAASDQCTALGCAGPGSDAPEGLEFRLLYPHSASSPRVTDISFFKMTRLRFLASTALNCTGWGWGWDEKLPSYPHSLLKIGRPVKLEGSFSPEKWALLLLNPDSPISRLAKGLCFGGGQGR